MYLVFRVSFSALQLYLSVCCWGRRLDPDATRALQVELVHVAGVLLVELSNQQNTYVVDFKNVTNHLLKMKATSHEPRSHSHSLKHISRSHEPNLRRLSHLRHLTAWGAWERWELRTWEPWQESPAIAQADIAAISWWHGANLMVKDT